MTNPFEYFNASDDEDEPKTTLVKKDDKHKLSNSSLNQLTQRREPTKNNKRIKPKKLLKSLRMLEELQLKNLFLKELERILIEVTTCLVTSSANSIKKYGVKRIQLATISIVDQELAESNIIFIQRTAKKGWRWIWKCGKPEG